MDRFGVIVCAVVLAAVWALAQEKEVADAEFPPRVVKTEPADRTKDVDYRITEIKVTFDRPMQTDKAWSWMIL